MAKHAEHDRIEAGLTQILKLYDISGLHDAGLNHVLELADQEFLSLDGVRNHRKFIPNSIVLTMEDNPNDKCFYTPNGVNLIPIIDGYVAKHPHKEFLINDHEDIKAFGFHDVETYIKFYEGFDNDIVCIQIKDEQPA